jgi:hypothetical protein
MFKVCNGRLYKLVYSKYITLKGKRVYPKKSKVFRFWAVVR